ncbi:hypothetical protein CEE44_04955 [Candidatus Woesearchaeota archaeon B3_Woes]|nr:MAG: hypothetical protein CEE44_04955 [Candidatus Woesearchaeota archaeon B3_Woes]
MVKNSSIDDIFSELRKLETEREDIKFNTGASEEEIESLKREYAVKGSEISDDYLAFLRFSNGAEISDIYFHSISELEEHLLLYDTNPESGKEIEGCDDVVEIASDNGDPITIDVNSEYLIMQGRVLNTAHDSRETMVVANNFNQFLRLLVDGVKQQYKDESDIMLDRSRYWLQEGYKPTMDFLSLE